MEKLQKSKRERIYEIIDNYEEGDKLSYFYDVVMIIVIIFSIIPLMIKEPAPIWQIIDKVCVAIFIVDYILRWMTADYKFKEDGRKVSRPYLKYPFTFMAILDLLSILPSLVFMYQGIRLVRVFRLIQTLRVVRVLRAVRYSKSMKNLGTVFKNSKKPLTAIFVLAIMYILISALVLFNAEPESFNNFFDALYWATISLTTIGYGDLHPVTNLGKLIAMLSAIFGIAIIALPSGVITAGYLRLLEDQSNPKDERQGEEKNPEPKNIKEDKDGVIEGKLYSAADLLDDLDEGSEKKQDL